MAGRHCLHTRHALYSTLIRAVNLTDRSNYHIFVQDSSDQAHFRRLHAYFLRYWNFSQNESFAACMDAKRCETIRNSIPEKIIQGQKYETLTSRNSGIVIFRPKLCWSKKIFIENLLSSNVFSTKLIFDGIYRCRNSKNLYIMLN